MARLLLWRIVVSVAIWLAAAFLAVGAWTVLVMTSECCGQPVIYALSRNRYHRLVELGGMTQAEADRRVAAERRTFLGWAIDEATPFVLPSTLLIMPIAVALHKSAPRIWPVTVSVVLLGVVVAVLAVAIERSPSASSPPRDIPSPTAPRPPVTILTTVHRTSPDD